MFIIRYKNKNGVTVNREFDDWKECCEIMEEMVDEGIHFTFLY